MKLAISIFVLAFAAVVLAAPAPQDQQIQLLKSVDENDGSGSFVYGYEQSNNQIVAAQGGLKSLTNAEGQQVQAVVQTGHWSFVGPDGQTYWVIWTADENGFHPTIGVGGGGPGDSSIDPNALKSLIG